MQFTTWDPSFSCTPPRHFYIPEEGSLQKKEDLLDVLVFELSFQAEPTSTPPPPLRATAVSWHSIKSLIPYQLTLNPTNMDNVLYVYQVMIGMVGVNVPLETINNYIVF